jgi:flagellar motility protein MotE (MotC chaperone)
MKHRIPAPRLLPLTIAAIAALLGMKSASLVRAATTGSEARIILVSQEHGAAKSETHAHAAPAAPKAPAPGGASGGASGGAPASPPGAKEPAAEPPVSDAEKAVLLELRQRRLLLDSRESVVGAREAVLAAAEQKLAERVGELTTLQKRLETLETGREQREDTGWQGLVKMYETMKPREAAVIFNDLAMPTLLQIMDRMKESKAAPVMSAMSPDRARDVTAGLARLRLRREAPGSEDSKAKPAGS